MAARISKAKTTSNSVSTKRKVEADISNKKEKAMPIGNKRLSKTLPSFFKNKWVVLAIILGAMAGLLYLFKGFFVVAMVGNTPLFRHEVINQLESQYGGEVTDSLITKKLVMAEAKKKGISVTNQEVDTRVDEIKSTFTEENGISFEEALSYQGITEADLIEAIRERVIIEKMFADQIEITEEAILGYYDENKELIYQDQEFDAVKDEIKQTLQFQQIDQKLQELIQTLRQDNAVKYFREY